MVWILALALIGSWYIGETTFQVVLVLSVLFALFTAIGTTVAARAWKSGTEPRRSDAA